MPRTIVSAVLFLVFFIACSMSPSWRTEKNAEGRFAAEFPRPVRHSVELAGSANGKMALHFTTAQYGMSTYSVMWVQYPNASLGMGTNAVLDAAVEGAVKNQAAGLLVHTEAMKVSGKPARHFVARFGGDMWLEGRIVLAGNRVFQATVSYRDGDEDAKEAHRTRFLESLKVSFPLPLSG